MLTGTAWAARFDNNNIIILYRETRSLSTRTNNKLLDVRSGQIASSSPYRPVTHVFSTYFFLISSLSFCVFIFFCRRIKQICRATNHSHFQAVERRTTGEKNDVPPRPRVINAVRVICTALRVFRI